jgi:putative oxidoreductase
MNIVTITARILLGLLFVIAGGSDFLISSPPPQPGLAGQFDAVFFQSHWVLFLGAAQVTLGALLLVNRFVPIALIILAAFLYNSFGFHITMAPGALWAPAICTVLGLIVARPYRGLFALLFAAKPQRTDRPEAVLRTVRAA